MLTKSVRLAVLLAVGVPVLGGCSFISTTTDTTSNIVKSATDTTSSTTGGSGNASAFIDQRYEAIRLEAARGTGEHLDSLAALRGETDRAEFASFMKDNYGELFGNVRKPAEFTARLEKLRPRG